MEDNLKAEVFTEDKIYELADEEKKRKVKKPQQKLSTRTLFPGLINLVNNDGKIKYLLKQDNQLKISEFCQGDGKTYQPKQDLPIKFITPDILKLVPNTNSINTKGILDRTIAFIKQYLELPFEQDYLVLALWIFHTYLIEKFKVTPILYFFGVKETGKTRAGEVLSEIAYMGERLTSPTEASLFRSAHLFKTTLIIDEIKLWGSDGNKEVANLIKSRYKRGMRVSRINMNKSGEDQLEYYDVFAPLVICSTESMPPIIESRCITFIMQQNTNKDVEKDIDENDALVLRKLLTIFRYFYFDKDIPEVDTTARRRLNEITQPLLQICELIDPSRKEELIDFIKLLEKKKTEDEGEGIEAEIIKCVIERDNIVRNRKFSVADIVKFLNENQDEKFNYSPRYVSNCVKRLGFERTRLSDGKRGFIYDKILIKNLIVKYQIDSPIAQILLNNDEKEIEDTKASNEEATEGDRIDAAGADDTL